MHIPGNMSCRWRDAMDLNSQRHGPPMIGLIKYLPEVCLVKDKVHSVADFIAIILIQAVLDKCQTMSSSDTKSKDFYVSPSKASGNMRDLLKMQKAMLIFKPACFH
jgi:hypothetical protein